MSTPTDEEFLGVDPTIPDEVEEDWRLPRCAGCGVTCAGWGWTFLLTYRLYLCNVCSQLYSLGMPTPKPFNV